MEKANENQPSAGKFSFSSTSNTPSPDKGSDSIALQIPQISLPKGGGAIKGIDEKFEVNAANGTASLSLPLPFSAGRGGFMPAAALGYSTIHYSRQYSQTTVTLTVSYLSRTIMIIYDYRPSLNAFKN
jgi:hypothetical protein